MRAASSQVLDRLPGRAWGSLRSCAGPSLARSSRRRAQPPPSAARAAERRRASGRGSRRARCRRATYSTAKPRTAKLAAAGIGTSRQASASHSSARSSEDMDGCDKAVRTSSRSAASAASAPAPCKLSSALAVPVTSVRTACASSAPRASSRMWNAAGISSVSELSFALIKRSAACGTRSAHSSARAAQPVEPVSLAHGVSAAAACSRNDGRDSTLPMARGAQGGTEKGARRMAARGCIAPMRMSRFAPPSAAARQRRMSTSSDAKPACSIVMGSSSDAGRDAQSPSSLMMRPSAAMATGVQRAARAGSCMTKSRVVRSAAARARKALCSRFNLAFSSPSPKTPGQTIISAPSSSSAATARSLGTRRGMMSPSAAKLTSRVLMTHAKRATVPRASTSATRSSAQPSVASASQCSSHARSICAMPRSASGASIVTRTYMSCHAT
mmetsp:Transcript_9174/g.28895  ORF Transcript_9174/g.28895 Transcript_9174/m.28895 type:complete len:443 (+) Transcript_9174:117-1445(+)